MTGSVQTAVLARALLGMQDLVRASSDEESVYTGGDVENAMYRNHGTHAGAIEIILRLRADLLVGSPNGCGLLGELRPSDSSSSESSVA